MNVKNSFWLLHTKMETKHPQIQIAYVAPVCRCSITHPKMLHFRFIKKSVWFLRLSSSSLCNRDILIRQLLFFDCEHHSQNPINTCLCFLTFIYRNSLEDKIGATNIKSLRHQNTSQTSKGKYRVGKNEVTALYLKVGYCYTTWQNRFKQNVNS